MAAAVEPDSRELGGGVVETARGRCGSGDLESLVQVRDVCLVVLIVVKFHDLLGDAWLEGLVGRL